MMVSIYKEAVRDALYPKKKGRLRKDNKFLSVREVKAMDSGDVHRLRTSLFLSTAVFSSVLSVSPKTVEAWESGANTPSGPALRLMNLLARNPDILIDEGILEEHFR